MENNARNRINFHMGHFLGHFDLDARTNRSKVRGAIEALAIFSANRIGAVTRGLWVSAKAPVAAAWGCPAFPEVFHESTTATAPVERARNLLRR
jgi:hypothetical protein